MIRLKRILLPTDFSELGAPAAEYACELAERFDADLQLLHIVEDPYTMVLPEYGGTGWMEEYVHKAAEASRKELEKHPAEPWRRKLRTDRAVRRGVPFLEIVDYARENESDLIVMGTHGRSGLMHVLMGSVAERVVRKSPCPVLTVRPAGHAPATP